MLLCSVIFESAHLCATAAVRDPSPHGRDGAWFPFIDTDHVASVTPFNESCVLVFPWPHKGSWAIGTTCARKTTFGLNCLFLEFKHGLHT